MKYWYLCKRCSLLVFPIMMLLIVISTGCTNQSESEDVELTLAVCSGAGILHEEMIWDINEGNYPFSIKMVDYLEPANGDMDVAIQNLNKDIISGDGPDMIDLSSFPVDIDCYAAKGVFEDLYPYLDADQGLDREDMIDSILRCCEYDGKLVGVMSGFSIKTMYTTETVCGGQSTWSIDEFIPYIQNIGVASLDSEMFIDPETLIYQLCTTTFSTFVDYTEKTAMFNSPEFIELLDAYKRGAEICDDAAEIKVRIDSVWDFMEDQPRAASMGGEIKYIGFPSLSGQESGHYLNNQTDYFSICATSKHKEEAWQFIRMFLMEDFQREHYVTSSGRAFPTNVHILEELAAYSMEPVLDESGAEVMELGSYDFPYGPATQDDVDKIMEIIHSVRCCQRQSYILYEIISEETTAFINGSHTAKETADLIQNRVGIYVAE